jgi:hypothetical protein
MWVRPSAHFLFPKLRRSNVMANESFRQDRDDNHDAPERDERPRWPYKRRHFPQHPRGQYAKLLDEMISRARAKREAEQELPLCERKAA